MGKAHSLANAGTPEALTQAIERAKQISSVTSLHSQAVQNINFWAKRILDLAYSRANYSLEQAIDIAQMVPSGTTSYLEAQSIIKTWEEKLRAPNLPLQEINLDKPSDKKFRNLEEEEE